MLRLLVFLTLSVVSITSHAFIYTTNGDYSTSGPYNTAQAACSQVCTDQTAMGNSVCTQYGCQCQLIQTGQPNRADCKLSAGGYFPSTFSVNWTSGCIPGYVDDGTGSGQCIPEPEPAICESGSDTIIRFVFMGQAGADLTQANGCIYEWSGMDSNSCAYYPSGDIEGCNMTFTQTDNPAVGTEPEFSPAMEGEQGTKDTRETTTNKTVGETTTTDNGDGTTTEQQTTTETVTEGQGTVMWEENGKVYVQDSTGKVTVTTQEQLIERASDNSYTETVTETKNVTTPTKTTTVIDTNTGGATTVTSSGSTSTSTKTTTNTYNSSGSLTSSNTTQSGSGTGDGEGDQQGECEPQLQECGEDDWGQYSAGDKSGLYDKTDKTYDSVITDFKNRVSASSLGSAMNEFFVVSLGGSCPTWSADLGPIGTITVDQQCSPIMTNLWPYISAVIMLIASVFAFRRAIDD